MDNLLVVLDGSKISWRNYSSESQGMTWVTRHVTFPLGGRPPHKVWVRSHRTGAVVPFEFVTLSDDGEGNQTLNYLATLADGRRVTLSLAGD